jgi:hypothetical protein
MDQQHKEQLNDAVEVLKFCTHMRTTMNPTFQASIGIHMKCRSLKSTAPHLPGNLPSPSFHVPSPSLRHLAGPALDSLVLLSVSIHT